jgi:zinc-binding alcohol dehydrogenase family protein
MRLNERKGGKMKAVGLRRPLPVDHPESLIDIDLPKPGPSGHDLLVEVKAVSVNPVDYKSRMRAQPTEGTPHVLGYDAAGIVAETGAEVTLFRPGDKVFYAGSIKRPGTNSQFHLVDERIVGPMPASLDFAAAAGLPLTTITAWEALFDRLDIDRSGRHDGRHLLIIAGAGGVGSIAIQLAKRLARLTVIATASRPASTDWCRKLGADHVIDHGKDLGEQLNGLGLPAPDYILCLSDTATYFPIMARLIAPQGRICAVVSAAKPLEMQLLMDKSASFHWEYMFTRAAHQTVDMIEQHRLLREVAMLIDKSVLTPTAHETLTPINAANLRAAHARLESGRTIGKIVLADW